MNRLSYRTWRSVALSDGSRTEETVDSGELDLLVQRSSE